MCVTAFGAVVVFTAVDVLAAAVAVAVVMDMLVRMVMVVAVGMVMVVRMAVGMCMGMLMFVMHGKFPFIFAFFPIILLQICFVKCPNAYKIFVVFL